MPDYFPRDRPHLALRNNGQTEHYRRPKQVVAPPPAPLRDRAAHAAALEFAVGSALAAARQQLAQRDGRVSADTPGFYLEIEIPATQRSVVDKLADRRQKMELVAVRDGTEPDAPIRASVFVPERAENYYLRKIEAYRTAETRSGRPRNQELVASINTVRLATTRSLFTDEEYLFPQQRTERVWWEIWLRRGRRELFERIAPALTIEFKPHAVRFPEREVLVALSDVSTLDRLVTYSDVVAELRRAKDTPAFFMGLGGAEQRAWSDDALKRLTPPGDSNIAVCLLDSGVTRTHPLLAPALATADCHTVNPAWGVNDTPAWQGHGTRMAGVALFGDLIPVLTDNHIIVVPYRLESVRILPPSAGPPNDPDLYGAITSEAITRAEVQAPGRRRAVAMAVTSTSTARGRPSSWSAAIDQLCFEEHKRLIIVSAGNIRIDMLPTDFLTRNDVEPIEDPAQAWNALTVGAFTEKTNIIDAAFKGYTPIAPAGELCPRSRTSVSWDRQWPLKPDVVFEGGNLAHDGISSSREIDDLQLLTTYYQPQNRYFTTFGDTSAATALAARMAASILAARPLLWPESVRALIVHSAEWTQAMRVRISACNGVKNHIHALVRRYGYGVPDLDRALLSARNDLTLIVEDELQPFQREGNNAAKTRDMNLHLLPWPREELAALGAAPVELRATLSYFIEPNPGERGWTRRHRYGSHGLRFRVKAATESLDEFRARINDAARDEEWGGVSATGAEEWVLGTLRDRGSLHSDFWRGTAADLAQRDAIGVFPVGGWWKEKPFLERFNEAARYALIVTIRAPAADVDIYTPVESQIAVGVEIQA
jgi:hypothetical protein